MDLSDAYSNGPHIPGGDLYPGKWAAEAAAFRDTARGETGVSYGPHRRETCDLFLPDGDPRGCVIFVHGGYWKAFDPSYWSHLAAGPLAHGYAVAIPGYTLAPEARIAAITAQIARAVDAIAGRIPGPLILTGHSAGGHLVARMGCTDVPLAARPRIAHILPVSPLGDLAPLLHTSMNADLRLDAEEARTESPVNQPAPDAPVTVWVGAAERPAFLDQARRLATGWAAPLTLAPGQHHFDVIEPLADAGSPLTRALFL